MIKLLIFGIPLSMSISQISAVFEVEAEHLAQPFIRNQLKVAVSFLMILPPLNLNMFTER
ncbi:hypothetical protein [Gracilibacillus xinjiangensis]|uniref:Uncharacterized protein n=1 Tax=Gracilibacillus xinjiangensis TaxID=1193282 RepID=A0ABV8WYJ3_9BACI